MRAARARYIPSSDWLDLTNSSTDWLKYTGELRVPDFTSLFNSAQPPASESSLTGSKGLNLIGWHCAVYNVAAQ